MFNESNDGETLRLRLQSFPLGSQAWRARSVRYRAKACVTPMISFYAALYSQFNTMSPSITSKKAVKHREANTIKKSFF
jgi:hypothetical protein